MKMGLAENLIESAGNNLNKNQKQANEINPETYALYQNYPNPFNPATVIKYQIPQDGIVSLKVYDILGKEVRILVSEHKSKGRYEVNFNASNLASGIYIYQLKVNDFSSNKKMMLIK
ncbi:MAG: T9SS type A sorting domain-containing protein [Ignavibacteriaceae bacterium]|nr:T9SS type A sorting domain-containing protein [Ignavibacteriaceae bacterium]